MTKLTDCLLSNFINQSSVNFTTIDIIDFYLSNSEELLLCIVRNVTWAIIEGGGGCLFIIIFMLCPTDFFWNQLNSKEILRAEDEYVNKHSLPPPPPQLAF